MMDNMTTTTHAIKGKIKLKAEEKTHQKTSDYQNYEYFCS